MHINIIKHKFRGRRDVCIFIMVYEEDEKIYNFYLNTHHFLAKALCLTMPRGLLGWEIPKPSFVEEVSV